MNFHVRFYIITIVIIAVIAFVNGCSYINSINSDDECSRCWRNDKYPDSEQQLRFDADSNSCISVIRNNGDSSPSEYVPYRSPRYWPGRVSGTVDGKQINGTYGHLSCPKKLMSDNKNMRDLADSLLRPEFVANNYEGCLMNLGWHKDDKPIGLADLR